MDLGGMLNCNLKGRPMRRLCFLIWTLLALPLAAQTPSPTPRADASPVMTAVPRLSPSPAATPTSSPLPITGGEQSPSNLTVADEFSTPLRSLERFMATMALASPLRPDLYLTANTHLDLSGLRRVVRDEQGITYSKELYSILQTADLDFKELDVGPDATSVSVYRQPSGDQVELVKKDGRWLFSAETVKAIPRMYDVLSQKGRIESWYVKALNFDVLGLNGNLWVALLLIPPIGYGLGSLIVMLLRIPLGPIFLKKASLPQAEQRRLLKPVGWLAASLFAWLALSLLDVPPTLLVGLTVGVKVIATIAVVMASFRVSDVVSLYVTTLTARTATKFDDMLIPLVRRTIKTTIGVIALLFLAQNLDIEVWSLFAGFSIFGAMVALAGQDMVKNFFGSVTVLADQPFAVGDWIVVSGMEGVVEEVGFRSTRIRTFYDSVITLPNSQLITASVDNYGKRKFRRYSKKISVRWDTSPETVEAFCEGIRELVRRHPYTRKDSYQVWVNDMNDYSLQILLYIFWAAPDWNTELREKHRFLLDLHRLAKELGILFAYPSQRLVMSRKDEDFDVNFDLEGQESARRKGKELTQGLLESSLPKETPPPAVVD
jgi:MscS family membrane protein